MPRLNLQTHETVKNLLGTPCEMTLSLLLRCYDLQEKC